MPSPAVSAWPSRTSPPTAGTVVFTGGAGSTVVVGAETAMAEPAVLEAVTSLRTVESMSAPVRT